MAMASPDEDSAPLPSAMAFWPDAVARVPSDPICNRSMRSATVFSWSRLTASFPSVPLATWTIWRGVSADPTDTAWSRSPTASKPIAVAPFAIAAAPTPNAALYWPVAITPLPTATADSPVAIVVSPGSKPATRSIGVLFRLSSYQPPMARLPSPVAAAPKPIAELFNADAAELNPNALLKVPLAMFSRPKALLASPLAVFWYPNALPPSLRTLFR
ncbi:hypothetical protein CVO77_19265 [Sphingopyxis lindanitolerans]|uniref:Uncharacterized protein n=1 Tax=Sphingopyxis lindanitolerans TaxID=2054227 RepID=A0A2S8B3W2_9SPHN|nr:hypothetical protein CVO77_19265 [Sphingopyxis lindanitolerans]